MTQKGIYSLKTTPEIQARISRLHPSINKKIRDAVREIVRDPGVGKSLKDELKGLKSFRTGKFRIIYRVDRPGTVSIIAIGPRKTIYEETLKLMGDS